MIKYSNVKLTRMFSSSFTASSIVSTGFVTSFSISGSHFSTFSRILCKVSSYSLNLSRESRSLFLI